MRRRASQLAQFFPNDFVVIPAWKLSHTRIGMGTKLKDNPDVPRGDRNAISKMVDDLFSGKPVHRPASSRRLRCLVQPVFKLNTLI